LLGRDKTLSFFCDNWLRIGRLGFPGLKIITVTSVRISGCADHMIKKPD